MKTLKEALEKRNSDKKKALPSSTLEYMDKVTKDLKEAGYEVTLSMWEIRYQTDNS